MANAKTPVAKDLPKEELKIEYWSLDDCLAKRWAENHKKHNIPELCELIGRYGFRDPLGYDATLQAFTEGNGRVEAVAQLRDSGAPVPRGILEKNDPKNKGQKTWFVPVIVGVNAQTVEEAKAYAIEHNNSVLSGGDFLPADALRLWTPELMDVIASLPEEHFPVTLDDAAIHKLMEARKQADPDPLGEDKNAGKSNEKPEGGQKPGEDGGGLAPSHVRMVQLFLNTETISEFEEMIEAVSEAVGTDNPTDTVMEALRREVKFTDKALEGGYENLFPKLGTLYGLNDRTEIALEALKRAFRAAQVEDSTETPVERIDDPIE